MKILYGVQGTGNGHLTRARVMAKAFKEKGIEVDWIFSGREKSGFFDMEIFGDYKVYRGMTFVTEHGKINFIKTALQTNIRQFFHDIKQVNVDNYDLIFNDFEPVSAWAARRAGKKTIGVSHQNAFYYKIPKKDSNFVTNWFMHKFAPVDLPIGIHWHPYDKNILPPIVEHNHYKNEIIPKRYLVYLPFASPEDIVPQLLEFPDYEFYVYQPIKEAIDNKNVHLRPFSREGFQQDLHCCEGVMCSAGFELPSESLHLGKKLLVKPLAGQMEQASNGLALQELGYGTVAKNFDFKTISEWLKLPARTPLNYPNVAKAVIDWIIENKSQDVEQLHKQLWGQIKL
ncbi:MAG: glycosyl transferase [Cellvibrio sp.]|nr:glycosyl transferase [Cellvibrio sp.]